jgi:hypothetical protein
MGLNANRNISGDGHATNDSWDFIIEIGDAIIPMVGYQSK